MTLFEWDETGCMSTRRTWVTPATVAICECGWRYVLTHLSASKSTAEERTAAALAAHVCRSPYLSERPTVDVKPSEEVA